MTGVSLTMAGQRINQDQHGVRNAQSRPRLRAGWSMGRRPTARTKLSGSRGARCGCGSGGRTSSVRDGIRVVAPVLLGDVVPLPLHSVQARVIFGRTSEDLAMMVFRFCWRCSDRLGDARALAS